MAFQVSPGVQVSEIDLTSVVPAIATTAGAIAGDFKWGPVEDPILVTSENDMVLQFNEPNPLRADDFFVGRNFLAYGNQLWISRAVNQSSTTADNAKNATTNSANTMPTLIRNEDHYESSFPNGISDIGPWVAKYPGALGNSLKVSICPSAKAWQSVVAGGITATKDSKTVAGTNTNFMTDIKDGDLITLGSNGLQFKVESTDSATSLTLETEYTDETTSTPELTGTSFSWVANGKIITGTGSEFQDELEVGDILYYSTGVQLTVEAIANNTSLTTVETNPDNSAAVTSNVFYVKPNHNGHGTRRWEYYNQFEDGAPGTSPYVANRDGANDEIHVIVVDNDGSWTGTKNNAISRYSKVSQASDAKTTNGANNYYKNVINRRDPYIWWASHDADTPESGNTAREETFTSASNLPQTHLFHNGSDGEKPTPGDYEKAYIEFAKAEQYDIGVIMLGNIETTLINYLINEIAEVRKDCVACVSPKREHVVNNNATLNSELNDILEFRNTLPSSSYGFMDSGWKYQYDKYSDQYRYVPLNGDIAGLMVQTDLIQDAWYSPAGFNRGNIKNIVRLAYNPSKAHRDELYKQNVNPVVSFQGQGTVLFGDKTLLSQPSAFDRINVRRLFIILEKAIATASQRQLFEFNDEFTRQSFVNLVTPFLREVKGRRGITDFRVVCDSTNNTGDVIERNEFVGDIFVKPNRSINFIRLQFIAVRSDVSFNEIVGAV